MRNQFKISTLKRDEDLKIKVLNSNESEYKF